MKIDIGGLPASPDTAEAYPFLANYLWKNKTNRNWWMAGFAIFLLQLLIFKLGYPFANYMPDSYSYLEAASSNVDVNMWPIAYSKFLRLLSVFTHSDTAVVALQYFLLQSATLLFLFTLLYFLKPANGIKIFLLSFTLLNPLPLYVANYISADALFMGLSLLWLISLIWIIYRPRRRLIFIQAFLLLACFTVRYNAIYYPLISLAVLAFTRITWKYKLLGFGLSVILVLASISYTSRKMEETTGKRQFSAFGGWQMANNALYMYEHVPANERGSVPLRFARLENMVREHMDTLKKVKLTHDDSVNNFFYLWNSKGPLIQYLVREYKKDSTTPYFKRWASEGPLYSDYAFYLIRKFPSHFVQHFLAPNAIKYFAPPLEFLGIYNMGGDSVNNVAKDWFKYKTLKIQDNKKKNSTIITIVWYPAFSAMVNVALILGLVSMLILNAIRWKDHGWPQLLGLVLALWLSNCIFSIFASPIVMRYQVLPVQLFFPIAVVLISRIYEMATTNELT